MAIEKPPVIHAVGLGPSDPALRTEGANKLLHSGHPIYLRTANHPGAEELLESVGATSFDHLYESSEGFDEVYQSIVEALVVAAEGQGEVVYAVPGSPLVAERTVELLRSRSEIELHVEPGVSFCDLAWARLGVDPLRATVRLVDGGSFVSEAAGDGGPLLVGQCWSREILSGIKLAAQWDAVDDEPQAVILHHLGLPDERVVQVAWSDLDRTLEPDHLTSLWIPNLEAPVARELILLDDLVRTLRQRCPWDKEQTHSSLRRHLLEEAYEVLDAIDGLQPDAGTETIAWSAIRHLEEELGDLLFQIYFHARLASEEGWFTIADVAATVRNKLIARHPHVFGDVQAETAGAVEANWEQIKKAEKNRASITEGIPTALPALALAAKLQRKAQSVNGASSYNADESRQGLMELADRLAPTSPSTGREADTDRPFGELLWKAAEFVRLSGFEPEDALREAGRRFAEELRAHERRHEDPR